MPPHFLMLPRWLSGKEPACQCRRHRRLGLDPWVGKIWRRVWLPTPVFLPGKSLEQMAWRAPVQGVGCKESATTEWLSMYIFYYINEREKNNSIHLSYSPKCSSLIKNVGSNSLVCLSSTPCAPPLSSSCSFLHQHSPPGSSPIWAGTAGEVVTDPSLHQGSQLAARICVECRSDHRTHKLKTEVSSFFCEGSCSKYVQLCESVTTTQLCHRGVNSHRKYGNEWPWLRSNKNVFTKTGWEPAMAQGCCWLTPSFKPFILWPVPLGWNPNSYRVSSQHALALPLLVPSFLTCWVPATLALLLFRKLALLPPTSGNSHELLLLL